jgi:hypothetical protein
MNYNSFSPPLKIIKDKIAKKAENNNLENINKRIIDNFNGSSQLDLSPIMQKKVDINSKAANRKKKNEKISNSTSDIILPNVFQNTNSQQINQQNIIENVLRNPINRKVSKVVSLDMMNKNYKSPIIVADRKISLKDNILDKIKLKAFSPEPVNKIDYWKKHSDNKDKIDEYKNTKSNKLIKNKNYSSTINNTYLNNFTLNSGESTKKNSSNKLQQVSNKSLINKSDLFSNKNTNIIKKLNFHINSHYLTQAGKMENRLTKTNQDSYLILEKIFKLDRFSIYGVFDGHGI